MNHINELKLATYKSAMDKAAARRDDKGNEIADKALEGIAKAIGRELKDKSFIIKSSDPNSFNKIYGYNHFGNTLSRPWSGQYKMTFTGEAKTIDRKYQDFDPSDFSLIMGVTYAPANEQDGGARGNLKILGYDKYTKNDQFIQFSIRNGGVQFYDRRISNMNGSVLQLTRKDARLMASIAKELADAIGGDASAVNHNAIKQFTPLKESQTTLKHVKLYEQFINESDDFYKSYGEAIDAVQAYAQSKGYELDQEEYGFAYTDASDKPKNGETKEKHITLYKNGREQRKALHVSMYGRSGGFEVTMYIN